MALYPTRSQILARPVPFRPQTLAIVRRWKRDYRGRLRTVDAIETLVHRLATSYDAPVNVLWVTGFGPAYNPARQIIRLNPSQPSIVSALHELAHHLFGRSELVACRWSVSLFRKTFPKQYARLTWRGHLLVKAAEVAR